MKFKENDIFVKKFDYEEIKSFTNTSYALTLKNNMEFETVLSKWIEYLSEEDNFNKESLLDLLEYFQISYEYDSDENGKYKSIFPNQSPLVGFDERECKTLLLLSFNYILGVGSIAYHILDHKNISEKFEVFIENTSPFSKSKMLKISFDEIIALKRATIMKKHIERYTGGKLNLVDLNAYTSTTILIGLFENEIKLVVKIQYTIVLLIELLKKVSNNEMVLSSQEWDLISFLICQYTDDAIYSGITRFEGHKAQNKLIYLLFDKSSIIDEYVNTFKFDKKIFKKELSAIFNSNEKFHLTLNNFLNSNCTNNLVEERFLKSTSNIFGTKNLNLRNQISHGISDYFNYFNISTPSLLYLLFLMVNQNMILKEPQFLNDDLLSQVDISKRIVKY